MLILDGSHGEGGGQILRTGLTLSILTRTPFILENIRARRSPPGLKPQHRMCVRAAAEICGAHYKGAEIGSQRLVFEPGAVKAGSYRFDIGTAGAVSLVLQTVALPLAIRGDAASEVTVTGGTHVPHSPSFHELDGGWRPALERIGIDLRLDLHRLGFYPRGGGEVLCTIQPNAKPRGVRFTEAVAPKTALGLSLVAGVPDHVAERQAARIAQNLKKAGIESHIVQETRAGGPGTVAAVTFRQGPVPAVFAALGERGKPAERVADEAVERAIRFRDRRAAIEPHLADQIALPLALADGPSEYTTSEVTEHLRTNLEIIRRFVDRPMACEESDDATGIVRIG